MNNRIAVAFITHNSVHWLEPMLTNLGPRQAIIFDNASTDDTVKRCRADFSNTKLIANDINIGYGRAANEVFKEIDAPYALLLNPDVDIEPDQLQALVELPQSLDNDWLYIAPNTGHVVTALDAPSIDSPSIDSPSIDSLKRITHATGCALLINLENFNNLGGFDENIFLYYEEMDLSIRAHEAGFKMYYAENIHFPHNSKKSVADDEKLESTRNWHFQWSSLYYKKKHGLSAHFAESVIKNLVISPFRQLFVDETKAERYRIKRKATIEFLKGKPAFLKSGHPYIPG